MSLSPTTLSGLASIVGSESVLSSAEDLIPYSFDGTAALKQRPDAVVFPRTTEQVAECVRLASSAGTKVPLVTRGSGTGLSGGSVQRLAASSLFAKWIDPGLDRPTDASRTGGRSRRGRQAAARQDSSTADPAHAHRTIGGKCTKSGGLRG